MSKKPSTFNLLKILWSHLADEQRKSLLLLLLLMLFASLAEMLNVAAAMPFLLALTDPGKIYSSPMINPYLNVLGITGPSQILIPAAILFASITICANMLRLGSIWMGTRIYSSIGADLTFRAYLHTLRQPFLVHTSRNSSEVIVSLQQSVSAQLVISLACSFFGSFTMLIGIAAIIFYISPSVALATFFGFGMMYGVVVYLTREKLLSSSKQVALQFIERQKTAQEALGGIRDILLDGTQKTYAEIYNNADVKLRRGEGNIAIIGASPRFFMESAGIIVIISLACYLSGNSNSIPILGTIALGAQRLLPVLQQLYSAWSGIQGNSAPLRDALALLDQQAPKDAEIAPNIQLLVFKNQLKLENIFFSYAGKSTLKNINLTIQKGDIIGLVGQTGSGKSTLLDIIMGLIPPENGRILVDDQVINSMNLRSWQAKIAHVPQSIFLADATIQENIAFGVPRQEIDQARVAKAAALAQMSSTIESWVDGYFTEIGERGVRLSGGQRQRIGIARAFYKGADLIILDEATSALDSSTELDIISSVEHLTAGLSSGVTILMVAHRLTTLRSCNKIIEVKNGEICWVGGYAELLSRNAGLV
jgi:ABC-type multidrug transport system fused ATPase/permease subunit